MIGPDNAAVGLACWVFPKPYDFLLNTFAVLVELNKIYCSERRSILHCLDNESWLCGFLDARKGAAHRRAMTWQAFAINGAWLGKGLM